MTADKMVKQHYKLFIFLGFFFFLLIFCIFSKFSRTKMKVKKKIVLFFPSMLKGVSFYKSEKWLTFVKFLNDTKKNYHRLHIHSITFYNYYLHKKRESGTQTQIWSHLLFFHQSVKTINT